MAMSFYFLLATRTSNFLKLQHTPNFNINFYSQRLSRVEHVSTRSFFLYQAVVSWIATLARLIDDCYFFYLPFRSEPLEESLWSVMRFPPVKHFLLVLFEWALKLMSYEFFLFHVCLLICCADQCSRLTCIEKKTDESQDNVVMIIKVLFDKRWLHSTAGVGWNSWNTWRSRHKTNFLLLQFFICSCRVMSNTFYRL